MNLSKHLKFFDPINDIKAPIHIIGCGAIGSTIAEMLTRMGVPELHVYDFDTVEPHNIANQMFWDEHATKGYDKENAIRDICLKINPNAKIIGHGAYDDQKLSGFIFLCVDNIDLRRKIVEAQFNNPYIKAMFDFRMRLTDAQHYAADWNNRKSKQIFLDSMNFSHEEAKEATPVNACGTTLNIITTVRSIVSFGLANFINFVKNNNLKKIILVDSFSFIVDAF